MLTKREILLPSRGRREASPSNGENMAHQDAVTIGARPNPSTSISATQP